MKREKIYKQLELGMLKYVDLIDVLTRDNGESILVLKSENGLLISPIDDDMSKLTGSNIYVRKTVTEILNRVATRLKRVNKNYNLQIVYGYRALEIQKRLFKKFMNKYRKHFSGTELLEAVHRNIAVPEISGHPTGGAVDLQIVENGKPLEFGTKIWEFNKDSYTFSPFITNTASKNRKLLRELMLSEGFAPFDGEWWHFSFGDREWAAYYGKSFAIYEQIKLDLLDKS
jgi:D-alanyl-D-alanine dipeptidase